MGYYAVVLGLLKHAFGLGSRGAENARFGKYRIIRRLAEGGMGEIFLARQVGRSGFEKVVVLKRILRETMQNPEAVRMFLDEARLQATLDHPNIVQVYDFGAARGAYFFTMEYVFGEDLGQIMKASARATTGLSLEFALGVITEAATGLHHAHEKHGKDGQALDIIHRDISPSNVLVSYDGSVKVTDFGIAKWANRETKTQYGALKGKIAYMSPEQCRADTLDRRSDVFALGILLYELVTGSRLYQGTSDFAILEQVVNQDTPSVLTLRPDLPPKLAHIIDRALRRVPDERPATARKLADDLEDFAREARLKISAGARGAEMERLFATKIGSWRKAAEAGRSLGQHLLEEAGDGGAAAGAPLPPDLEAMPVDARTGTLPDGGRAVVIPLNASADAPFARNETPRQSRRGRAVLVALALAAAGVATGAIAVKLRAPALPAARVAPVSPAASAAPAYAAPTAPEEPVGSPSVERLAAPAAAMPEDKAAKPRARTAKPRSVAPVAVFGRSASATAEPAARKPERLGENKKVDSKKIDRKKGYDPDSVFLP